MTDIALAIDVSSGVFDEHWDLTHQMAGDVTVDGVAESVCYPIEELIFDRMDFYVIAEDVDFL